VLKAAFVNVIAANEEEVHSDQYYRALHSVCCPEFGILENTTFRKEMQFPKRCVFWLYGNPGDGQNPKTVQICVFYTTVRTF
jgi:hypothetical protein